MPKVVSDFRLKLELLLRAHPQIRTRRSLASDLGLSDASQITKWQGGDSYTRAGRIPVPHFERMCALFDVDPAWFDSERTAGETREEYERRLQAELGARQSLTSWQRLLHKAVDSDALWLHAVDAPSRRRALSYPSSPADGDVVVAPDDRVYVELRLETPGPAYLVVFTASRELTRCLSPTTSELSPPHGVEGPVVRLPVSAPETCLRVDRMCGPHALIAIVMSESLPRSLLEQLLDQGASIAVLEQLAVVLDQRPPSGWQCLRRGYHVQARESE